MLSTSMVFSLPLPFSSKYPSGSLSIFSTSALRISFSVLYAALCESQVDIFIAIPLPSLHIASKTPRLTILLQLTVDENSSTTMLPASIYAPMLSKTESVLISTDSV